MLMLVDAAEAFHTHCTGSGMLLLQNTQRNVIQPKLIISARRVAQRTTTYDSAKPIIFSISGQSLSCLQVVDTAEAYRKICTSSGILLLQITLTYL